MLPSCLAVVFVCLHINLHFYHSGYLVMCLFCEINDFIPCEMFAFGGQFLEVVYCLGCVVENMIKFGKHGSFGGS